MARYKHLTLEERENLQELFLANPSISITALSLQIGRDKSTISRELRRNRYSGKQYQPHIAQRIADERRKLIPRIKKLDNRTVLKEVRARLKNDWSPEQTAQWTKINFPGRKDMHLSHETIYQAIYAGIILENPQNHLRRKRKRRKSRKKGQDRRGTIPNRRMIDERPKSIDNRRRYGHWEGDTIEGAGKDGYMVTLVERKMRQTIAVKVDTKEANVVADAVIREMRKLPKKLRRSLTVDNGKEFSAHKMIEKELGLKVYFSHPRSPWERGTNENTNGLLRQYFPKGMGFANVTKKMVDKAVDLLNNRIRKVLNWRSPQELFNSVALRD